MAIGIRGFAAIIAVAALMVIGVACGNGAEPTSLSDEVPTPAPPTVGGTTPTSLSDEVPTPAPPTVGGTTPTESDPPTALIVSHGGPVKDYVSLVDRLRAVGATVDPAGTEPADQLFAPQADDLISGPTQVLTVNGEDINAYEFGSAEEADAGAEGVSASGSSIVVTYPDGTGTSIMVSWVESPHFYKAGKLIVLYVGCDSDVIDVLQETMGPQFAGGAGVGVHGVSVVGHGRCPEGVQPVPAISSGPPLRLTFDGVEYRPIVCCGTPIDMDDMEVVGTGTRNNPDGDASVEVYRPKAGATTDVYIFHPAQPVEDRKPGGPPPSPAQPATWTRWTDDIAPPAPAAEPVLTFEGVEYTGVDVLGALSPTGVCVEYNPLRAATLLELVTPCHPPIINMDDMEVVGTGTDHNPDGDASVEVYRPKAGATTDVYTFHPWADEANTTPAIWTRWIAK